MPADRSHPPWTLLRFTPLYPQQPITLNCMALALIVQGLAQPRRPLLLAGALQIVRALLRQSRCGMH